MPPCRNGRQASTSTRPKRSLTEGTECDEEILRFAATLGSVQSDLAPQLCQDNSCSIKPLPQRPRFFNSASRNGGYQNGDRFGCGHHVPYDHAGGLRVAPTPD